MAIAIHAYIVNPADERIQVEHIFYGRDLAEAQRIFQQHMSGCSAFSASNREGRIIEDAEEIPDCDVPQAEEDVGGDGYRLIDAEFEARNE